MNKIKQVYATVVYGEEFNTKYSKTVNDFGKDNSLFVLTDRPELYDYCNVIDYYKFTGRNSFSYYYKNILLLHLVIHLQTRVTYVDADYVNKNLNKDFVDDNTSVFTSEIMFDSLTIEDVKNLNLFHYSNILSKHSINALDTFYPTEAFISFPYREDIDQIYHMCLNLQKDIEDTFNSDTCDWSGTLLERYPKYGIGFGEGTAMVILMNKFNLNIKGIQDNNQLFF